MHETARHTAESLDRAAPESCPFTFTLFRKQLIHFLFAADSDRSMTCVSRRRAGFSYT
jgi:hypothetical protein